jgi:hypothetical protein
MSSPKSNSLKALYAAADHLTQTDKGRKALKGLEVFFDQATGLDASNALACLTLVDGFFGAWTGSAIEAVREAANPETEEISSTLTIQETGNPTSINE